MPTGSPSASRSSGEPNFSPDGLAERSQAEYAEGSNLWEMI